MAGGLWSGDYLVIDAESLDNADSIGSVRVLRVKDIVVPPYFTFPVAAGSIKQPEDLRVVFKGEDDKLESSKARSHDELQLHDSKQQRGRVHQPLGPTPCPPNSLFIGQK